MENNNERTVISKIEIDEKSNEPHIVEMDAEEAQKAENAIYSSENSETPDSGDDATCNNAKPKKHSRIREKVKQLEIPNVFKYNEQTSVNKRQKIFKNVFTVIFIVLVVGVLVYTAYNDFGSGKTLPPWSDVAGILGNCWFYLIFALLALFFMYFFKGIKLSAMCKSMTGKWHFKTCMETGVVGIYYNNVTPLAVGGQPFEIYHLSKHGVHGGVASSLPIAAFFLNQFAFVILGIISLVLFKTNAFNIPNEFVSVIPSNVVSVIAIIGLATCIFMPTVVVMFCFLPRAGASIVKFVILLGGKLHIVKDPKLLTYKTLRTVVHNSKCLKKIATNVPLFISCFIFSLCEQLALCSIAYFSLRFFGYDLPADGFTEWLQIVQICFILYAAISFIPTPGNSGAADLSFYLIFEIGLKPGLAFPAMLVWRLISFYSIILIGFVFTTVKRRQDLKFAKLDA